MLLDVRDAAIAIDLPRLDSVVVIESVRTFFHSTRRDQDVSRRLDVAGLIRRARLQNRLFACPPPRQPKACQRLRIDRCLEFGIPPGGAAVQLDLDARDFSATRPGKPADFVEALPCQSMTTRRARNH